MKTWLKNLTLLFLIAVLSLAVAGTALALNDVIEVYFDPSPAELERNYNGNGNYDIAVKIRAVSAADGTSVKVAGVVLDFDYDLSYFKAKPTILADYMTSNLMIDEFSVAADGRVHYKKVISSPYFFEIPKGTSVTIFKLRYSVLVSNALDNTTTYFDLDEAVDSVVNRIGNYAQTTWANGVYTIRKDSVAPNISAVPTSRIINGSNYNTLVPIDLNVTGLASPSDFKLIKYTTDGSDPSDSNGAVVFSHPAQVSIPQNATTNVKFYVQDLDDNKSSIKSEIYIVDCRPLISASPPSATLNAGDNLNITLTASNLPSQDDLAFIKYTTDGTDPKTSGTAQTYSGPFALPANLFTIVSFYGQHDDGTQSLTSQETYVVDVIDPYLTAFSANQAHYKQGADVIVNFTVSEALNSDPAVKVGLHNASLIGKSGLSYIYRYTVSGQTAGMKTIQVNFADAVGNATSDATHQVEFDFTAPTFDPIVITPRMAQVGVPLEVTFKSSERLSTTTTLNVIGLETDNRLDEIDNGDGTYTYIYRSPALTGFENTSLIIVHGYDLAGNGSNSNDGWGDVSAEGRDVMGNPGTGTTTIKFDFVED